MVRGAWVAAIAALVVGCGGEEVDREAQVERAAESVASSKQQFLVLGSPDAPTQLTIYTRVTDYAFLDWVLEDLPALASGPLREGRAGITLRPLPDADDEEADATRAARLAIAAAGQDRAWSMLVPFADQYVGFLDDGLAGDVLAAAELDVGRARRDAGAARTAKAAERSLLLAKPFEPRRPPLVTVKGDGEVERSLGGLEAVAPALDPGR